ncbi:MAG TPA: hypothetical protein VGH80_10845 [Xanthomonadaceae bacterium]|jgi:hypothetical protein
MLLPQLQRRAQTGFRLSSQHSRFQHNQLACLDTLTNSLAVVDRGRGECVGYQPATHPGVILLEQHHRVQTSLFHAGGKKHSQIQARRQLAVEDTVGRADLLAVGTKRSRRIGILKVLAGNRTVDRCDLLADVFAALRLVTTHRRAVSGLPQQHGSLADEGVDRWVVRHAKSGQQLGKRAQARPLVVSEDIDRLLGAFEYLPLGAYADLELCSLRLR